MMLWIVLAVMVLIGLAWILPSLLRRPKAGGVDRGELHASLLRTRLSELEADLRDGTLSESQFQQSRSELEREFLDDMQQEGGTTAPESAGGGALTRWPAAIVLIIALPALAFGIYSRIGNWSMLGGGQERVAGAGQEGPVDVASIEQMVASLESRLQSNPNDAEGWAMLGRSYRYFQRYAEAAAAYERAISLKGDDPDLVLALQEARTLAAGGDAAGAGAAPDNHAIEEMLARLIQRLEANPNDGQGWVMLARSYLALQRYDLANAAYAKATTLVQDNPDVWADYGDALATSSGGRLVGRPAELVQRALALNPRHPKALWLAGTASFQEGDFANAIAYWERLRVLLPENSEDARIIRNNIVQARERAGEGAPPAAQTQAPASGVVIKGVVSLDDKLAEKVAPTDTVFIYARASEGPTIPLAVVRKQVKDLPVAFTLDDSLAMMPTLKLSNYKEVVVGARISKSGNAGRSSGDLEAVLPPIRVTSGKSLTLSINQIVP